MSTVLDIDDLKRWKDLVQIPRVVEETIGGMVVPKLIRRLRENMTRLDWLICLSILGLAGTIGGIALLERYYITSGIFLFLSLLPVGLHLSIWKD